MPVTVDQPAPYAPASAILELIERHRNKGLPPVVDSDVLVRAGISDSLIPRTLQALKTLDLLTDDGRPSDVFEAIRLAPSAEYQQRLSDWLRSAYADALFYVDPATDDEIAIRDAFRKYIPTGQQGRMVTLFIGLFTAAGVIPQKAKPPTSKRTSNSHTPAKMIKNAGRRIAEHASMQEAKQRPPQSAGFSGGLPPAIAGLLATLPPEGGYWTQDRRDGFMATLGAVIDYTYKIGEQPTVETNTKTATDQ